MAWIDFLSWLRPNTEAFKAIVAEVKELKDGYRKDYKEQMEINKELHDKVEALENHEAECHRQLIRLSEQYRNVKEELIFLRKQKPDS